MYHWGFYTGACLLIALGPVCVSRKYHLQCGTNLSFAFCILFYLESEEGASCSDIWQEQNKVENYYHALLHSPKNLKFKIPLLHPSFTGQCFTKINSPKLSGFSSLQVRSKYLSVAFFCVNTARNFRRTYLAFAQVDAPWVCKQTLAWSIVTKPFYFVLPSRKCFIKVSFILKTTISERLL